MKFGLDDDLIEKIQQVFEDNPKIDEVLLFGSRAKGNHRKDSDIDLAVKGRKLSYEDIVSLGAKLDELNLAYGIDLLDYTTIAEPDLVEHIDRVGVVFWERWKEAILENVSSVQTGPFGSQLKNEQYVTGGTPVVTVEHIKDFKICSFNYPSVCEEDKTRLSKYLLAKGDIIFTRVGSVDLSAYVNFEQDGWMFSSRMLRVRPNAKQIDGRFLSYYFQQPSFREHILNIAVGATMPSINTGILKGVKVLYPSLKEQTLIASTLSSLDDKIDLLQRQNRTLEALAEAAFKKTFIEDVNIDWEVGKLEDVISVKGGTTPSSSVSEYWNGDIYWTTPRDLSNHESVYLFDTERKITEKGLAKIGAGLLPMGTVLLSSRAPIGYLAISAIPVAINQGYIAIICDKILSNYFIYLWCKANVEKIKNAGNGSVFQEISKGTFKQLDILIPSKIVLKTFDNLIEPTFSKIKINQIQIKHLTKLRDSLLPKLMSGEVRVSEL